ncbi:hypothetical protein [Nocardioides sp.]|uniref:hypothetical protein n=1 Tax=Nocardioides sp. TaxID=35761 RepID=UPI002B2788E1|nr:hypothetical protein [Nocardioides sp.]
MSRPTLAHTHTRPTTDAFVTSPMGTWQVALDRLELDVVRLEHHLDHGRELRNDIWDAPEHAGPLPDALRERAEELHARQLQCLERLATSIGTTVRQHELAEAVTRVSPGAHGLPLYVDIAV